jgi:hypothetical protein
MVQSPETGRNLNPKDPVNQQCIYSSFDESCTKCAGHRPCGPKVPTPRQQSHTTTSENILRFPTPNPPTADVGTLVDEAADEIRTTIQRMVEGYDNTRRLTRQDLIDHFVDLNHGETLIKPSPDALAGRVGRRRTIAAIRGDLSRTRLAITQSRQKIDEKLNAAMDQEVGIRAWKDELTPLWEDLKHLYDIFDNLLVELDKAHKAREERQAERVRVHRTVNRGNADPYRGAHLKIQNLVHSSPDILSYHSLISYLIC